MSSILFSLFGWTFVPDFVTKHLLNFLYQGSPIRLVIPPTPGSFQHRKHYALTFAFVVLGYLLYTLVQSARAMQPNFYELLGVPPNVDENGLKLAFRAFAKRFHPDRPGVGRDGEALFMAVRDAYGALKDPVVRTAYDRFGPEALLWRHTCKTTREFMHRGLLASSGYHIVTGIGLFFWAAIGVPSPVSFWRYILFLALFAGELSFIVSPFPDPSGSIFSRPLFSFLSPSRSAVTALLPLSFPSILQTIFPQRVPYQHILFLHQLFMFLTAALSRVVPQLIFLNDSTRNDVVDPEQKAIWGRIFSTLTIADKEASLLLHTILQSITPSSLSPSRPYNSPTLARMRPLSTAETSETLEGLTPDLHDLVLEANIKNHSTGPIAAAWETALRRVRRSRSSDNGEEEPGSGLIPPSQTPKTPRTRHFWEKEAVDELISLANDGSGLPTSPGAPSMSKVHSPMGSPSRKAAFSARAGEF